MPRPARAAPDVVLIEAKPTARCPFCKRMVTVTLDLLGGANIRAACPHYSHAERIEGVLFVAFSQVK